MSTVWQRLGAFVVTAENLSDDQIAAFAGAGGSWIAPVIYGDQVSGPWNIAHLEELKARAARFKVTGTTRPVEVFGWFNCYGGDPAVDAAAIARLVRDHRLTLAILDLEAAYEYPDGNAGLMPPLVAATRGWLPNTELGVSTNGLNNAKIWNGRTLSPQRSFADLKVRVLPQSYSWMAAQDGSTRFDTNMKWLKEHGATDGNFADATALNGRGVPLCVTPETRVLTHDLRWVPCADLEVGDALVSCEEHGRGPVKKRRAIVGHVTAIGEAYRPGYALYLADGTILRCSAEHPWLISTQSDGRRVWYSAERLAEDLKRGRRRRLIRLVHPWRTRTTRDAGYLAGLWDGEGHLQVVGHHRSGDYGQFNMTLAQKGGLVLDEAKRLLDLMGIPYLVSGPNKAGGYHLVLRGKWQEKAAALGSIRPRRLLDQWLSHPLQRAVQSVDEPEIVEMRRISRLEIVPMSTSTRTYFAEGFAAHNSYVHPTFEATGLEGSSLAEEIGWLAPAKAYGFTAGWSYYALENAPAGDVALLAAQRGKTFLV